MQINDNRSVSNLTAKLLLAAKSVDAIAKRGTFESGKTSYSYARSDDIVAEVGDALQKAGVMVSRIGCVVTPLPTEDYQDPFDANKRKRSERALVSCTYLVSDPGSGESFTSSFQLMAISAGGQGINKAVAGTATSCDGYFYCGLLQLPRFDENEIAAQRQAAEIAEGEEPMGDAEAEVLRKAIEAVGKTAADLVAFANGKRAEAGSAPRPANLSLWPKSTRAQVMTWVEMQRKAAETAKTAKPPAKQPAKHAAASDPI